MNHLRIQLSLDLFGKIFNGVTIEETGFFGIMTVEIEIKEKSLIFVIVIQKLCYSVDGWLLKVIILFIITVKILVVDVHPIVSVIYPIRINHWNYLKHKKIP